MPHKPKSIYCHYKDSLIINSNTLKSFLVNNSVSVEEIKNILDLLTSYYEQKINVFSNSSDDNNNWTKLESGSFSSPLILFIYCIDKIVIDDEITLSNKSKIILKSFLISLEPWMIW
ncbi:MAG: hypothetical protein ACTHKF_05030 [Candidatus Nitrosocosmicus sp.]